MLKFARRALALGGLLVSCRAVRAPEASISSATGGVRASAGATGAREVPSGSPIGEEVFATQDAWARWLALLIPKNFSMA